LIVPIATSETELMLAGGLRNTAIVTLRPQNKRKLSNELLCQHDCDNQDHQVKENAKFYFCYMYLFRYL